MVTDAAAGWCFCGLYWLLPGFPDIADHAGVLHTHHGCPEPPPP
jgi:hypothetical protein